MAEIPLRWIHVTAPGTATDRELGVYVNVADLLAAMDACGPDVLRGHVERLLEERVEVADAEQQGQRP